MFLWTVTIICIVLWTTKWFRMKILRILLRANQGSDVLKGGLVMARWLTIGMSGEEVDKCLPSVVLTTASLKGIPANRQDLITEVKDISKNPEKYPIQDTRNAAEVRCTIQGDLLQICAAVIERCISTHSLPPRYGTLKNKAVASTYHIRSLFQPAGHFLFLYHSTPYKLPIIPYGRYLPVLKELRASPSNTHVKPEDKEDCMFTICLGEQCTPPSNMLSCHVGSTGVVFTYGSSVGLAWLASGVPGITAPWHAGCCVVMETSVLRGVFAEIGSLCHVMCIAAAYLLQGKLEMTVDLIELKLFRGGLSECVFTAEEAVLYNVMVFLDKNVTKSERKTALVSACQHHRRCVECALTSLSATLMHPSQLPAKLITRHLETSCPLSCSIPAPTPPSSSSCCYTVSPTHTTFTITSRESFTMTEQQHQNAFKEALQSLLQDALCVS